jgi:hypothetical protein
MKYLWLSLLLFSLTTGCQLLTAQTISFGGYCDTTSNPGQAFELNGLGQRTSTNCTYSPGSPNPSVFQGELVTQNGTIRNLYVKQQQLNFSNMGGTATVWINPKAGGLPTVTSISCNLSFSTSTLYLCSNTGSAYTVVPGDRVLVVVTPSPGLSISPVSATLDEVTTTTTLQPYIGYCGSDSNPGLDFVLNGLGQRSLTPCTYGPGSPTVSVFLGEVIRKNGVLRNLYAKQQQLNSAPYGGTVTVWVNQKTGGSPVQTGISCVLSPNGSLYTCNNTGGSFNVVTGDKVIVIVTPPNGQSTNPVVATVDVQ